MTPPRSRARGPTVAQRLVLAVVPALLAVVLVVALSYYGEIGRQVPELVVAGSAVLAGLSLFVTWRNVGYVRRRLERLAGVPNGRAAAGDELDRIERTVDRLGSALSASEAERASEAAAAAARLRDAADLLSQSADDALRRLDDVRLPLHILLDARFGELSPNQEELVADARDAAAAADTRLRRLRALADAERGALALNRERLAVDEVLRGVVPAASARAERRGGRVTVDVEPALPQVAADPLRLAEALDVLLGAAEAAEVRVTAARTPGGVALSVRPAPAGPDAVLGRRLLEAQGLAVAADQAGVRVTLPGA